MSRLQIAFWVVFALAMAVYVAMVSWALPTVSAAAGGLAVFDLRPTGYSFDEARQFLTALTPEGRAFYLHVQQPLDLFYPPLISATLFLGIGLLTPVSQRRWRWLISCVALPIVVFDYLENAAVAGLLNSSGSTLTAEAVAVASRWTQLKSVCSALAMTTLMVLLIAWAWRRWRGEGVVASAAA
jgi:hypothetical protein